MDLTTFQNMGVVRAKHPMRGGSWVHVIPERDLVGIEVVQYVAFQLRIGVGRDQTEAGRVFGDGIGDRLSVEDFDICPQLVQILDCACDRSLCASNTWSPIKASNGSPS